MHINIIKLKEDYKEGKVVPFIGAGLSSPFKIPTWGKLILNIAEKYIAEGKDHIKKLIEEEIEAYDYWEAIRLLKRYTSVIDEDIQDEIVQLIKKSQITLEDNSLHNYSDIAKMNFKLHLTTNYDNLLDDYLSCEIRPIILADIKFNTQQLFDERRVCHLHGYTSNSGTIVISRESYEELYNDNKYDNLLKLVTGSKKLLFMGFSFDDQFIKALIQDHRDYFKSTHYIILDNPTEDKEKQLREEYGLLTIPYDSKKSSHAEEIRKILDELSKPDVEQTSTQHIEEQGKKDSIVRGAGLEDLKRDVEGNLFYQKLKLEDIDELTLELSKIFYLASDKYIRELKDVGISLEVIDNLFFKVFVTYKERYKDTYQKYRDSELFVTEVHNSLKEFDFGRLGRLFEDIESDENENRGLIHLLAEKENMDIWWGKGRLNGTTK
jgi:hypothetical protein